MTKRILLLVGLVGLAVLVILIVVIKKMDTNKTPESEPTQEGWVKIEHPTYGISFSVPKTWEVVIFGGGTKEIRATSSKNYDAATLSVYKVLNETNIGLNGLIQKTERLYSVTTSDIEKYQGIIYVGRDIIDEDIPLGMDEKVKFMEDSYLTGRRLIVGTDILEMTCSAYGSRYVEYISTCNDIVESLSIK